MAGVCLTALFPGEAEAGRLRDKLRRDRAESAPPPPLSPDTFAHALKVDGAEGQVLSLELDGGVYSGLERDDFKDLCVFDASGAPVPFMLVYPEDRNSAATGRLEGIRIFPWNTAKKANGDDGRRNAALPDKTDIEIDTDGGIVRIRTQRGGQAQASTPDALLTPEESPPAALLLDMSKALDRANAPEGFSPAERRSVTLRLEPEDAAAFTARVRVLTSGDLERWQAYGTAQHITRITHAGERIDKLAVGLPVDCPRYVLLEFSGDVPRIGSIKGEAVYSRRVVTLKDSSIHGRLSEDRKSVLYHVNGVYPLSAFNLDLAHADVMAARLETQTEDSRYWRVIAKGSFYRLEQDGAIIQNDPISLNWPWSREWRLSGSGDIPFAEAPAIRLFWKPHTIFFLARGQGPWTVAYGREFPVNAAPLPDNLLATAQKARVLSATALPAGGVPRSVESTRSDDGGTGRMLLWGALALAVVFLTGIAFYLMRNMKKE